MVLRKAIEHYGEGHQVDMAIEEMSELTKALLKERRYQVKRASDPQHMKLVQDIIEEIADVTIMLEQMTLIFDADGGLQVELKREEKITRLKERIEDEEQRETV